MKNIRFKKWDCKVVKAKYEHGEANALILVDSKENHETIATASVNVPEAILTHGDILIKDYSENEGILDCLVENKIVEDTGITHPVGFVVVHECKLLI